MSKKNSGRGRKPLPHSHQLNKEIKIRFKEADYQQLKRKAEISGMELRPFLRHLILEKHKEKKLMVNPDQFYDELATIGLLRSQVGTAINQSLKKINTQVRCEGVVDRELLMIFLDQLESWTKTEKKLNNTLRALYRFLID